MRFKLMTYASRDECLINLSAILTSRLERYKLYLLKNNNQKRPTLPKRLKSTTDRATLALLVPTSNFHVIVKYSPKASSLL